jgi:TRAP-type C4-dicarboxylate transport system permease small subunit
MHRALTWASQLMALAGGLVLSGAALLTDVSIAGRWLFDRPIFGDVELMQVGCAVAIALFLPECQIRSAHVRIDFFTARARRATRDRLDAIGAATLGLLFLLLAWRAGVGVLEMRANGETTMVLGFPTWLTYLAMVPGLAVAGVIGLVQAFDARQRAAAETQ